MAAALLVAVSIVRDGAPPATAPRPSRSSGARRRVRCAEQSVAVLPSGVVVDASAVAVLPFTAAGDATLAEGLERDVVAALRTVPGLYVIADGAVQPYAATRARGRGDRRAARRARPRRAAVELVDGRVLVERAAPRIRDGRDVVAQRRSIDPSTSCAPFATRSPERRRGDVDSSLRAQVARADGFERALSRQQTVSAMKSSRRQGAPICDAIDFHTLSQCCCRRSRLPAPRRRRPAGRQPAQQAQRQQPQQTAGQRPQQQGQQGQPLLVVPTLAPAGSPPAEREPRVADGRARAAARSAWSARRASGFSWTAASDRRSTWPASSRTTSRIPSCSRSCAPTASRPSRAKGASTSSPTPTFVFHAPVMQTDDASIPADEYVTRVLTTTNIERRTARPDPAAAAASVGALGGACGHQSAHRHGPLRERATDHRDRSRARRAAAPLSAAGRSDRSRRAPRMIARCESRTSRPAGICTAARPRSAICSKG